MSELKSRPPTKSKQDLNAFIAGAEVKVAAKYTQKRKEVYPWEQSGVREDVTKVYNLRL